MTVDSLDIDGLQVALDCKTAELLRQPEMGIH